MRRTDRGFTLIELLVASAIALLLLGLIGSVVSISLRMQARENQNVPVQQALRASIEVIAYELRASVGPRVMFTGVNSAGYADPPGLSGSDGASITLLVPEDNSTFTVLPPTGYPSTSSLAPRSVTALSLTTLTDAGTTPLKCTDVFKGGDYGVLYSTLNTNFQTGASRAPDAFRVFQVISPVSCPVLSGASRLNHAPTPLPALTWNPNTYAVKVRPVRYFVSGGTLYRQLIGESAQVVAYNISSLSVTYLPDNPVPGLANCAPPATFTPTPTCTPRSVNLTLTSTPQNAAVPGARPLTASQIVFLR